MILGIIGFILWIIGICSCWTTRWWLGVISFFVAPIAVIEGACWCLSLGDFSLSQYVFDKITERNAKK